MFDIADIPFTQVKEEDKPQFTNNIKEVGSLQGYKPRSYWVCVTPGSDANYFDSPCASQKIDNGIPDQMEHYNSKFRRI